VAEATSPIPVPEAVARIDAQLETGPVVTCPLKDVSGEVLREDVVTERDEPPFDRVMMDGIAIRHSDKRSFAIQAVQAAGQTPLTLDDDGGCIEVMTGAVLPVGCDCVIPIEDTGRDNDRFVLGDGVAPQAGQFIHRQGSGREAGSRVLASGTVLGAAETADLASAGKAEVQVAQRPAIAVMSTGDELVDPGEAIESYQVRRSNPFAIDAALQLAGFNETRLFHANDDRDALLRDVGEQLGNHSVLILSGGVSMGKHDYIPEVMSEIGVRPQFHRVTQRPGKPMWFGTGPNRQLVFALPGNPVSVLVCLYRYVLPALWRLLGAAESPPEFAALTEPVEFAPALTWFLPVCLQVGESLMAQPCPPNTSGDLTALAGTDGFVELPAQEKQFAAGYRARLFRWGAA